MTTIFVGGSRSIAHLPAQARDRLDNVVASGAAVVVGDAAGADAIVQRHLLDAGYRAVEIFASEGRPRHNLGDWPVRAVSAEGARSGYGFFAAKDRAMAEAADFGLMIWDGKSPGTVLNILRLLGRTKKAVLIEAPDGRTTTFRDAADWRAFLDGRDARLRADLRKRATAAEWNLRGMSSVPRPAQPGLAEDSPPVRPDRHDPRD
jgi:adenine-specific DNA-methyltransferase